MLPPYVDLTDKRIVVFGGGVVAERKIRQIFETDGTEGQVEVYSRDFRPWIVEQKEQGEIQCFRLDLWDQSIETILKGAFLILICTDDKTLNKRILKEAEKLFLCHGNILPATKENVSIWAKTIPQVVKDLQWQDT